MPPIKPEGKAKYNQLGQLRPLLIALMQAEGRDFTRCELCNDDIPANRYDLHHTRYDGATYRDLLIVCRKCNTTEVNRYLQ